MGVQIEAKQQASTMIRLVGNQLVKEEAAANIYVVPPKGEYQFEVTGYALPFEMEKGQEYGGGTQTMTRIELTITEGKGKGKMFTQLWGFSIGPKSNLGKFCQKMGVPLPGPGGAFDLDEIIGYVGTGYVTPGEALGPDGKPKYAKLALDTVEGISVPQQAFHFDGDLSTERTSSNGSNSNGNKPSGDDWPDD